jgi:hypothetical protein
MYVYHDAEDSDKLKSPSPANKMSITFHHNQDFFLNGLKHHLYTEYIICVCITLTCSLSYKKEGMSQYWSFLRIF